MKLTAAILILRSLLMVKSIRKIGEVKSAGNSNDVRPYTFIDNEKAGEVNYYRLKWWIEMVRVLLAMLSG